MDKLKFDIDLFLEIKTYNSLAADIVQGGSKKTIPKICIVYIIK